MTVSSATGPDGFWLTMSGNRSGRSVRKTSARAAVNGSLSTIWVINSRSEGVGSMAGVIAATLADSNEERST